MTAASDDLDNGSDAYQEKIGISGSHAYSLLGAFEIENVGGRWQKLPSTQKPRGTVERLVQLRNPWGKGEWKGSWSDTDARWTPQLRNEVGQVNNADDGIFCMTFNDFCKYFSDLQICYYHENFKYSAIKLQSGKTEKVYLTFKIVRAGVFYLSLNQKLTRAFPKSKKYKYSNLTFTVTMARPEGCLKFIASQIRDDFENWTEQKLEPGTYYVEIKSNWISMVNEFSFSVYGEEMCAISRVPESKLPPGFQTNALTAYAKDNKECQAFNFGQHGYPNIGYRLFDNQEGIGYVYFDNHSTDTILNGTVDFTGSQGIALKPPHSGLKPSFVLLPGKSLTVAYEAKRKPYSMQMQIIASFDKLKSHNVFTERVRQSPNVIKRLDEYGREADICVHVLQHQGGVAFLYINKNPQKTLTETVTFHLVRCHIDGVIGNALEVTVPPNSEKLFKVVADEPGPFEANVVSIQNKMDYCW
jgi:calpain-15